MVGHTTLETPSTSPTSRSVSVDGEQNTRKRFIIKNINETVYVPVLDHNHNPVMPTSPSRARRWVRDKKATGFWDHGIYCVRLNQPPSDNKTQPIVAGIDTGSKKEGFSVKSAAHTFLNIQADAVTWVKDAVETKSTMRTSRRFRKTPCRANRQNIKNRKPDWLPPSTKSRWQWKIRICKWLQRFLPITGFIVEDIKATTRKTRSKKKRGWNASFSPLEVGKQWFYEQLGKLGRLRISPGHETCELRQQAGLAKSKNKMAEIFSAHCVDGWVLANDLTGGHDTPDNTRMLCVTPLRFHRRQLHRLQPEKGGTRKPYGGTISLGFKRGSLVTHPKYGITYVGGYLNDRISLHNLATGKRLCQNAKPAECKFLAYNTWRTRLLKAA